MVSKKYFQTICPAVLRSLFMLMITGVIGVGNVRPVVFAQEKGSYEVQRSRDGDSPRRNLFSSDPLFAYGNRPSSQNEFIPGPNIRIPDGMSMPLLKGYIEDGNRAAAALIELQGGRVHLVHEGDLIRTTVGGQEERYMTLRVLKLNKGAVTLQWGGQSQVLVLQ